MTTFIYSHPIYQKHDMGAGHPESPQRLAAILDALKTDEFKDLIWKEPGKADMAEIERVHDPRFIENLFRNVPKQGQYGLDVETILCPDTMEAAMYAAGALVEATDAVIKGDCDNAFCAVRPPGHHAEKSNAMGFCFFNNVAIGAFHARAVHGLKRVAVLDFDVHHGNGTQHSFENDPDLFFASSHQAPFYPGSGYEEETGTSGNVVNIPMASGDGSSVFRHGWETRVFPAVEAFKPELIMISAGFDAHVRDPLASLRLDDEDFAWITREIVGLAKTLCGGKVVSTLEGGYDLEALASSTAAHVRELLAA